MSNSHEEAMAKEISPEEKLQATYKRLLITVIFGCIGWPVFVYAFNHSFNPLVMLLGGAIVSAPILYIMAKGGGLKDVFKTDEYEVITTHGDGRKTSDGGSESFLIGLIVKFFALIFVVFIGCLIQLGIAIWMTIRYISLYLKASEKPPFIKSAFPILILGTVVLFGSGWVINLLTSAGG